MPERPTRKQLAKTVLIMSELGGLPDTFWLSDARILACCKVLGWDPYKAREWAGKHAAPEWRP